MKKVYFIILCLLYLMVTIKFFSASYTIKYDVKDIKVLEKSNKNYMYYEIEYEGNTFNYMFYQNRNFFKKNLEDIKVKEIGNNICIKPIIKKTKTYYLCSDGENLISYNLVNQKEIKDTFEDDFYFAKNLNEEEYILVWKYDGFYYLNGKNKSSINIFNKDRYSNDLMFQIEKYLIFPKYEEDYLFSNFIVLDMTTGKYEEIKTQYNINYTSRVVGNNKSSIYIFDEKDASLYEINYKKKKCKLVSNEMKGYIKYKDGKKVNASLSEYTKDKITYFDLPKKYIDVSNNYFNYKINKDLKIKFYDNNIKLVDTYKNNIYFIENDNLYKESDSEVKLILHYFEFNFKSDDVVFIYNK